MATMNSAVMEKVTEAAKLAVIARNLKPSLKSRWLRAIDSAVTALAENPWIALRDDGVLVWASETGPDVYEVNGHCQCRAAREHQPCKHLALKRLLENHNKALALPTVPVSEPASPIASRPPVTTGNPDIDGPAWHEYTQREIEREIEAGTFYAAAEPRITFEGAQPTSNVPASPVADGVLIAPSLRLKAERYGRIEI